MLSSLWGRREGGGSSERTSGDNKLVAAREFGHSEIGEVPDAPWRLKSRARSIGRGGAPEGGHHRPSLCATPPTTSKATLLPLRLSSADNYDEDESASGGGINLGHGRPRCPRSLSPPPAGRVPGSRCLSDCRLGDPRRFEPHVSPTRRRTCRNRERVIF